MSVPSVLFYFLFTGNVVLRYGVGLDPSSADSKGKKSFTLGIVASILISSSLLATIRVLLIHPFNLDVIMPVLYLFIVSLVFIVAERLRALIRKRGSSEVSTNAIEFASNGLFYAIALIVCDRALSFNETVVGGLGAGLGYCAASAVLDTISRRIKLEPLADSLRGTPIYFISAGLVALAFFGLDQAFFRNLGW